MKYLQLFIIVFISLTLTKPDPEPLNAINLNINIPYEKPDDIQGRKRKEISDYRAFGYGNNGNNNGYIKREFNDIGYENAKYKKYGRYDGKAFNYGNNGNNNGYIKREFNDIGYENAKYTKYGRYRRYGGKATTPAPITTPTSATTPAPTTASDTAVRQIVGGDDTKENKYPWMVRIITPLMLCGGSVIAEKWILTATHCFMDADDVTGFNDDPKLVTVVIGEHDTSTPAETSLTKNVSIDKIIMHHQFSKEKKVKDIALLRLSSQVDLKVYIPVCLPRTGQDFTGQKAWVYGWGDTQDGGSPSAILQDLEITVVSDASAKQAYASETNPEGPENLTDEQLAVMLFAGGEGGKDACHGDSGGPLSYESNNGKHIQIGIVSWGRGCAAGLPAAYADVSALKSWIDSQTSQNGGGTFC